MNKTEKHTDKNYSSLIRQISSLVADSKKSVAVAINNALVETYWNIGKYIIEFEQQGNVRVKYGDSLLVNLSKDLTASLGKGFLKSNLFYMRLFYSHFPIFQTLSGKLSWTDKLNRHCGLVRTRHCGLDPQSFINPPFAA
jgi:hypothetical protein